MDDYEDISSKLTSSKKSFEAFSDWLAERGRKQYPEIKQPLFHYTNTASAFGILSSSSLWLTNIFSQKNDPFEIRSGMEKCYSLLKEEAGKASYSGTHYFADKFEEILREYIEEAGKFFLFCTSHKQDDPYQWVSFAEGRKGFCLEFLPNFPNIFSDTPSDDDGTTSNGLSPVFDVIYDEKKLSDLVLPTIKICIQKIEDGLRSSDPDKKEGWLFLQCMTVLLATHFIPPCAQYKPITYEKENEVRFLRIVPANRLARNLDTRKVRGQDHVHINCPIDKKCLEAIWIGPLVSPATQKKLEDELTKYGWSHVKLKNSKMPHS